ncbi:unnamed protein product [Vitrella brassicaformis CCMP3155]|uniref:Methyltransferase type 11 domain-containing protein n=1 Tax=Vitrella brassicaformis (strain CCMP3155) TaxID=1169540 RepID=A0A0G4EN46_VITBC|nr:unnamed protein product [Vitrella brassicaformis CCMP3155]|eukprot:CEL99262.1 unnamed protein product [Vitrella brassicaformis CCMP3155]
MNPTREKAHGLSSYTKDGGDMNSDNYEKTIESFGYQAPALAAAACEKYLPADVRMDTVKWLDAGCGTGKSVAPMSAVGISGSNSVGTDLMDDMLVHARAKDFYGQVLRQDLQDRLPFDDNAFNVVTCLGVLTYVDPSKGTLSEFCRVCAPGGLVILTHRTDTYEKWGAAMKGLMDAGVWEEVEGPVVKKDAPKPYLPGNPAYGTETQMYLCVYRVK